VTTETSSANRQIARAAGTVMVALVLSNLANLIYLVLSATTFGTQEEMDAFFVANRVSEILFYLLAGGALGSAFIPTFTSLLTQEKREIAWKLASSIFNLVLVVLTLAAAMAAVFAESLVLHVLAPGFANDPDLLALTVDLLRLMLPSAVIFGISGLIMGILNSHQKFFIPALTPALYRLGMIFGVIFLAPQVGIFGIAWGVLIGSTLHLISQIPSLLRIKERQYFPILGLMMPEVHEVGLLMAPRLFGVAAVQLNHVVNLRLASFMTQGMLTSLSWALTLMLMPQALIGQAVATAALPTFSAQFALGNFKALRSSLAASLRGILFLALPATVGLIMLRQPIVTLMLEYGQFDAQSTQLVSWALLWYAAGLVGHCIVEIFSRSFYALHNTLIPVLVGVLAMTLNIGLSILLSGWFTQIGWMPHGGLALANSLATGLEAIVLWVLMHRRLNGIKGNRIFQGAWQALLGSSVMALVLWIWLNQMSIIPAWVLGLGGVLIGGAVYGGILLVLRVDEVQSLVKILLRRIKRIP
jgi:putative peptidoglycan lipid II flippase